MNIENLARQQLYGLLPMGVDGIKFLADGLTGKKLQAVFAEPIFRKQIDQRVQAGLSCLAAPLEAAFVLLQR